MSCMVNRAVCAAAFFLAADLSAVPSILIDDKPANIHRWRQAGGIGIRFQTDEDDYLYLKSQLGWAMCERNSRLKESTLGDI